MKVTLSLDFNPDHDAVAAVTVKRGIEPIMVITFHFCAGANRNEHEITTKVLQEGGLAHYAQAKLILAGSELVDSIFSGEDVPSVIEV